DMGGTSTDVALVDGTLPRAWEREIAGVRIAFPQLDIHTIAAGGGSIIARRDGRLTIGPASAGAVPGPACYRRGGPATLTDVQLCLGRLRGDFLPRVFGADGRQAADADAARAALAKLTDAGMTVEQLAVAALEVAVESMANAIRHVSTHRGIDPAAFTLFAFGGAAGQHACRVAAACGMRRVLLHPLAGVLSAVGIGLADWLAVERAGIARRCDAQGIDAAGAALAELSARADARLRAAGFAAAPIELHRFAELRLGASETRLDVPWDEPDRMRRAFADEWERLFGYRVPAAQWPQLAIDAVRCEARQRPQLPRLTAPGLSRPLPRFVRAWFDGWCDVPVYGLDSFPPDCRGPALLVGEHTTLVLEPGWVASRVADGAVLAERCEPARASITEAPLADGLDAGRLEIFNKLFMHIAEQMGAVLQRTAQSVNIKERLDYSCAVFDRSGALVANAPHMPVHLGSMGVTVRAVLSRHRGRMHDGDAWAINSPYAGGTHLPDITVVSPVFIDPRAAEPDFFVAARAHHADIGGITPGSMPAFSRSIDDEGALLEDCMIVERGIWHEERVREPLLRPPWPARAVAQNLADLAAQLAANRRGIEELRRAAARYGAATLHRAMQAVQDNAAECVRALLRGLSGGSATVELDNGVRIAVRIDVDPHAGAAHVDFSGSSPQGDHNFNAPRAVCIAAVLYVLRTLLDRDIPLNEGCLRPLRLTIPPGSVLDPTPPHAVAAGNVETSQCIVDALFVALGKLAGSQGTMNNLTFGNEHLQYYETIAGGAGASATAAGCAAVQTHMTNSRLTDPEILEERFPVRVLEFSVRRGSGGAGRHRGGDGARRRLQFLAPLQGSILANRRRTRAPGLAGGSDGQPGNTRIVRADGRIEELPACALFTVWSGDVLEVLTPGGGGYGPPSMAPSTARFGGTEDQAP
ncbi:MAG: hydantoinase B/oxoprolinase family protein, partial [Steroidobacteraceae bacterium]|nr:hydantoinase B/oxoprolinase family protein [Steroidobacteraceae bacterium]